MVLSITGNDPAMLISYKVYGSGRPILLIPGFASLAGSWGFQYRLLKRYFKVITVEIKGICETGQVKRDYDLSAVVDDLSEFLASSGVSKTALVGSSMGAMIALEFARKNPEKVSSLIAVSLPLSCSVAFSQIAEKVNSSTVDDFSFKEFMPLFFSPDFVKHDRFRIFAEFFVPNGSPFSKEVLFSQLCVIREWLESKRWVNGCQCPSLFIYGSEDQLVSKDEALRQIAHTFHQYEFKVIEGAGHAVHIEKHQEFNNIVCDFLTNHKK